MNKYVDHIYVIPEDDANRQLALGFILHHDVKTARIQVMPLAGGWRHVLETFQDEYIQTLRNYPRAHVVMLIDFDDRVDERRAEFEQATPSELKTRVFVIGSKHDPETLKGQLRKSFEDIGISLANDCVTGTTEFWEHEQLSHNDAERQRMVEHVKPFLF